MERILTTRDVAERYGIPLRRVRARACTYGIGLREGGGWKFSAAEARKIGEMNPSPGRKPKHGMYVGWRNPDARKRALARLRKAGVS